MSHRFINQSCVLVACTFIQKREGAHPWASNKSLTRYLENGGAARLSTGFTLGFMLGVEGKGCF
ncbi:MAG: hypothetical protein KC462_08755, partial [Cyanobacteria bacterium HKST-UBA05]|nr:hypothetical protein [Cyanobacteria bacterium HKST-UBA05]